MKIQSLKAELQMKPLILSFVWLALSLCLVYGQDRPNVLWITAEDMSPVLGCYGDKQASTPNIDVLATKSLKYNRAFATAPVCSPSRSCLINGLPATSQGTHNMRSAYTIPNYMLGYPSVLRKAGYFTSNNVKTDYNSALWNKVIEASWDSQGDTAHWRDNKDKKPFFSVFNLMTSHQSRAMVWPYQKFLSDVQSKLKPEQMHDPNKMELPPYYVDTPIVRKTLARFYDCVSAMDAEVGALLEELKKDGLAEDTIVFFYSDHGSGLPRHKRALLDSGMKVPLLVHFPEKWKHLAPKNSVGEVDRLVNFEDFGPTLINLLGLEIPSYMEGKPFLGKGSDIEKKYVFGHRDRVDEVIDFARSVRSQKYLYIKNFMPHLGYHERTAWPDLGEIRHEFYRLAKYGDLTPAQKHYVDSTRPVEELYDCEKDPFNTTNLADSPEHQKILKEMRTVLKNETMKRKDLGFLPEPMLWDLSEQGPLYDWKKIHYPIAKIYKAAQNLGQENEALYLSYLQDQHEAIRYWGAVGLTGMKTLSDQAIDKLTLALNGTSLSVQVQAAEALALHGHFGDAKDTYAQLLKSENMSAVQYAARSIERLGHLADGLFSVIEKADARMKVIRPPGTSPVVVQPGKVDMAMFVSFSTEAYLRDYKERHSGWTDMFDGKSLKGWTALAEGQVQVKNGEISLFSEKKNLWLVHEKNHKNFELQVDVLMPEDGYNSGIGFRCQVDKKLLGYQCEVANQKTGSIYAIGKGWVLPKEKGQWGEFYKVAGDCFVKKAWNTIKIRCENKRLQIWVNGHLTADVESDMYSEGKIALQHHGKGDVHYFKNVKIKEL